MHKELNNIFDKIDVMSLSFRDKNLDTLQVYIKALINKKNNEI